MGNEAMIYLDNALSHKPLQQVVDYVKENAGIFYGNPQGIHQQAVKISAKTEWSRLIIAKLTNVAPRHISFTASGTEANRKILNTFAKNFKTIITSEFEHSSVLNSLQRISEKHEIPLLFVEHTDDTGVDLKKFKILLKNHSPAFVSLAHVNRLTGRLLPFKRIAEICHKNNSVFHSDMSLTIGKLDIDFENLKVDFATASSHKFGGLPGAGFLYVKNPEKYKFSAQDTAETLPWLQISAMAKALEISMQNFQENLKKVKELKEYLRQKASKLNVNSVSFPCEHFLPHLINLSVKSDLDIKKILMKFDMNGIAVGNGSFQQKNMSKNILVALNSQNTVEDIDAFIEVLKFVVY